MNGLKQLLLIAVSALLVVSIAFGQEAISTGEEIVEVEVKDHRITAPLIAGIFNFPDIKRRIHAETAKGMLEILQKFAYDAIKNRSYLASARVGGSIFMFALNRRSVHVKHANNEYNGVPEDFGAETGKLMLELLAGESDEKLSREELYERMDVMLEGAKQLVAKSPQGMYLDWNQMEIDGKRLQEYTPAVFQYLRKNYGFVMSGLKKVATYVSKLKPEQSS